MLDLKDVHCFVKAVEKEGISAAAHALDLPKSSVSRGVVALEEVLGVRLIQRTSRSFSVTDVGQEFYKHAVAMLESAHAAEDSIRQRVAARRGTIRFTCSVDFAQLAMASIIPDFMVRFPLVDIVQHATNRYVDPISEGFDFCLRAHTAPLRDSTLIIRHLADIPWHLFAGPGYLSKKGTPESPAELSQHDGVLLSGTADTPCWVLQHSHFGFRSISVPCSPRVQSDDMATLRAAACAGLGIVALPGYVGAPEVTRGRLVRVLPDWSAGIAMMSLLMPSKRGMLPSLRSFVDLLAQRVPSALSLHGP